MFGIDDAALATGFSALANLGGGLMSAGGAQANNQQMLQMQRDANFANMSFSRESLDNANAQANINRELQWKMSNTAYQRATADMRAAGINPMLAYMRGGASTESGSTGPSAPGPGQAGVSGLANPGAELGRGIANSVNSAVESYKSVAATKNIEEQNNLIREQTNKTSAETALTKLEALQKIETTKLTKGQLEQLEHLKNLYIEQAGAARASSAHSYASAGLANQQTASEKERTRLLHAGGQGFFGDAAGMVHTTADRIGDTLDNAGKWILRQLNNLGTKTQSQGMPGPNSAKTVPGSRGFGTSPTNYR